MKLIIKNLAVEYRDEGSGPVILLLHGWLDDLRTFDAVAADLVPSWRVIRLDLPGFGASEPPAGAWTLDDYVELVAAFVTKLDISVEVLAGHSFGGRIAIKGVASGRLRPAKVVLMASAGIFKSATVRNQLYAAAAKAGKAGASVLPLGAWRGRLRQALYRRAGSDLVASGPLKDTFLAVIREDLRASAARIKQPVLLIWGSLDTETPPADGQAFHELIAGSRLEILPGATHFVHQEKASRVAGLIKEFAHDR